MCVCACDLEFRTISWSWVGSPLGIQPQTMSFLKNPSAINNLAWITGKTLLLKTSHTLVIRYREIEQELRWELPPR